jgi:hypothetical protein
MKIKLFGWHMWLVYDTTTAGLVGAHSTNHGWKNGIDNFNILSHYEN